MLKIKDNVDLKELEKFGFVKDKDQTWTLYSYEYKTPRARFEIEINKKRHIVPWEYGDDYADTMWAYGAFLFDLIQAGFVEKVEE